MTALGRTATIATITFALGLSAAAAEQTYGMKQYADQNYSFSFWYPGNLTLKVTTSSDDKRFPGGTLVETVQIGDPGGVAVYVVDAPQGAITDEPNGHAAPIPQTELFFDAAMQMWTVRFPEGDESGKPVEPKGIKAARTIGGLPQIWTGARFHTTIIPLSTKRFVVVQDGGGAAFAYRLAGTVARVPPGPSFSAPALDKALRAIAEVYGNQ